MRQFYCSLPLLVSVVLIGCGGGGADDPAPKIKFTSQVSFGDNLSDVGSYAVGTVKVLGGGKYTVNGADSKNWTDLVATSLDLPAPCAAQTGLDGAPTLGLSVPISNKSGCTGYAQGGARVTNPVGPGNKLSGSALGLLTVPVATQIQNHLTANGGRFRGDEIVFVSAGPNDALIQAETLSAAATAAATAAVTAAVPGQIQTDIASGACTPTDAEASNCIPGAVARLGVSVGAPAGAAYAKANQQTYIDAMGTAGTELAKYVNEQILVKGARYIVVINMPDLSKTPSALSQSANTKDLLNIMAVTFNARLLADLEGRANILMVDHYTRFSDQVANPIAYGLTNVTTPACDLSPAKNLFGSSLVCNAKNLIAGDTSHYLFSDSIYPTPYGYSLFSDFIIAELKRRGWL